MKKLIRRARESMRRLRIMDLGCGSADGCELLMGIRDRDANLHDREAILLTEETLAYYKVIEGVGWLKTGLPRENVIEPQLGYALRSLVTNLQQGLGCAHGLVGIFEVSKP